VDEVGKIPSLAIKRKHGGPQFSCPRRSELRNCENRKSGDREPKSSRKESIFIETGIDREKNQDAARPGSLFGGKKGGEICLKEKKDGEGQDPA